MKAPPKDSAGLGCRPFGGLIYKKANYPNLQRYPKEVYILTWVSFSMEFNFFFPVKIPPRE